jgi:hypothetical protein
MLNGRRVIWWFVLTVLVLACAGAVVLTTLAYQREEQGIRDIANTMHSDFDKLRRAGVADAGKMQHEFGYELKDWHVDHGFVGDGIKAIVALSSCLAMFLLVTCLIERKRMLRRSSGSG